MGCRSRVTVRIAGSGYASFNYCSAYTQKIQDASSAMTKPHRTANQARRLGVAVGIVFGAVVAGLGAAPDARADDTATELLDEANADLTDANQALSNADVSNVSDQYEIEAFINSQTQLQDTLLQQSDSILTTQENILSNANALGSSLDNALFNYTDQAILQADAATLSGEQAFTIDLAAIPPGSGMDVLPVALTDFQLLSSSLYADFADVIGGLIQGL